MNRVTARSRAAPARGVPASPHARAHPARSSGIALARARHALMPRQCRGIGGLVPRRHRALFDLRSHLAFPVQREGRLHRLVGRIVMVFASSVKKDAAAPRPFPGTAQPDNHSERQKSINKDRPETSPEPASKSPSQDHRASNSNLHTKAFRALPEHLKSQQQNLSRTINLEIARGKSASRWTERVDAVNRKARHRTGALLLGEGRRRRRGLLLRRGRG